MAVVIESFALIAAGAVENLDLVVASTGNLRVLATTLWIGKNEKEIAIAAGAQRASGIAKGETRGG